MSEGFFISFEGGEGAGKSTQVRMLEEAFQKASIPTISTREPGGTPGGEAIRSLVVNGDQKSWCPMTELLLHMAARAEHIERLIRPALDEGKVVITDRFVDSTMIYQGIAQGLTISLVRRLHEMSFGTFYPHLTFVLDVPFPEGLERTKKRDDETSRYEAMDTTFHETLSQAYTNLKGNRFVHLDATNPPEKMHQKVIESLKIYPLFDVLTLSN